MTELDELKDELREYHRSFGWSPGEDIDEADFGDDVKINASGFWIRAENSPLIYVVGWEDGPFEITFSYDMASEIATHLDHETAQHYVDQTENTDDRSIEERAAVNILDEVDEEDSNDIDFRLRDILSSYPVWHEPYYTDRNRVQGFRAVQYIFPDEEKFTRSTYMQELSKLITVGQRGKWFLEYTYDLGFGQHGDFDVMRTSGDLTS